MKWDTIAGILRALIAFGGGYLVSKGTIDASQLAEISGAIIALGAVAWSVLHHSTTDADKKP